MSQLGLGKSSVRRGTCSSIIREAPGPRPRGVDAEVTRPGGVARRGSCAQGDPNWEQRWEPELEVRKDGAGPAGRGAGVPAVTTCRWRKPQSLPPGRGGWRDGQDVFNSLGEIRNQEAKGRGGRQQAPRGHGHGDGEEEGARADHQTHRDVTRPLTPHVQVASGSPRLSSGRLCSDTEDEPGRARDTKKEKGTRISLFKPTFVPRPFPGPPSLSSRLQCLIHERSLPGFPRPKLSPNVLGVTLPCASRLTHLLQRGLLAL